MRDFFRSRWRGEIAAGTILWRDMLAVGTVLNLLVSFVALIALTQGAPGWLGLLLHLSPLPYNAFLLLSLRRAPHRRGWHTALGFTWLALTFVV